MVKVKYAPVAQWTRPQCLSIAMAGAVEYLASLPAVLALVVKRISQLASNQSLGVRIPPRAQWQGRRGTRRLEVQLLSGAPE